MRLRDIEERLARLAERRWGEDAQIVARLDEATGALVLVLPDGRELTEHAADSGALMVQAQALLARHLEWIEPWAIDGHPSGPSARAQ